MNGRLRSYEKTSALPPLNDAPAGGLRSRTGEILGRSEPDVVLP
jgi:hypothetical protein